MTEDVAKAIRLLQERLLRRTHNTYWTERTELALDDLVRNPQRKGKPHHLVRNALANAGKILHRRSEIRRIALACDLTFNDEVTPFTALGISEEACHDLIFVAKLLDDGSPLPAHDCELLKLAAIGYKASEIATFQESSPEQVRVRLCRARARLREAWNAA